MVPYGRYHAELLNYIDVPVMDIHGKQKQQKRTTTFFQFCRQTEGILCCTDVAARGLDIPQVSPHDKNMLLVSSSSTQGSQKGGHLYLLQLLGHTPRPQSIGYRTSACNDENPCSDPPP